MPVLVSRLPNLFSRLNLSLGSMASIHACQSMVVLLASAVHMLAHGFTTYYVTRSTSPGLVRVRGWRSDSDAVCGHVGLSSL